MSGIPDAPSNIEVVAFKVENSKTVNVNVSWTPGYSGGYDQVFTIHYRVKGSGTNFVEQSVGHPDNNMHTVQGLLPQTEYEFTVQASNQAGKSQKSTLKQVKTPGTVKQYFTDTHLICMNTHLPCIMVLFLLMKIS